MKRRNVLIVEPERDEGELFARALEARRSYKCYVTGKDKEATTLLRDVPIDLMLLDVTTATNQDCSLLKRVKRDHPQLSIILVATTYQRELVQRARVHEVQGHLTNPIRIDEFRNYIDVFFHGLDSRAAQTAERFHGCGRKSQFEPGTQFQGDPDACKLGVAAGGYEPRQFTKSSGNGHLRRATLLL